MSWATRRRAAYGGGVFLFFFMLIGGPLAYWYLTIPPTCDDGIQNQGETSPDHGGPCPLLDEHALSPAPILWARSFSVRDGSYNSVAYIQNANIDAGVRSIDYRFALYDTQNVLVAEREGSTFVMPGAVTPVFESNISTGNREAVRTYFIYTEEPVWERMEDRSRIITINDKELEGEDTAPKLSATALNTSVRDLTDIAFIATLFDQAGNAFATSRTVIEKLRGGEKQTLTFTWPDPFLITVGRIDIIPLIEPAQPAR
jgi:hypothetical protein